MYDLLNGNRERAREYYKDLKNREPESHFVRSVEGQFEKPTALTKEIIGKGYGMNETEAKKASLADLSSSIMVEVQSEFESIVGQIGDEETREIREHIQVRSNLPILGATFQSFPMKPEVLVQTALNSSVALPLYEERLRSLKKEMDTLLDTLETSSGSRKHEILASILTLLNQFLKYKLVAMALNSQDIPKVDITESEIMNRLRKLEQEVSSIDLAAKLLSEGINQKGIYIHPPAPRGSHEVTQFANAVKDRLSKRLKTVQSPEVAEYIMAGRYEILENGIELTYHLIDGDFNTIRSNVVRLHPESYKGYEIEPKVLDFDRLLHEGYAVSNSFRVELATNRGRSNLLFKKDDELELLLKSNRPGYIYLVGHVSKKSGMYSYLLTLQEGTGNRRFIYFVNADDVNKWISLGRFTVTAPFGVESLQLVASSDDLVNNIPSVNYDGTTGMFKISEKPEEAMIETRGLIPARREGVYTAEAVLMFTTMGR
jgi:hypothetical protein